MAVTPWNRCFWTSHVAATGYEDSMSPFLDTFRGLSGARVAAMVTRYLYLLRSSWPRVLELIYWPTVQMLTWGFLQTFIGQAGGGTRVGPVAVAAGTLIGAMLLWDILLRGQLG